MKHGFLTFSWYMILHSHQNAGSARNIDMCRNALQCCDLEHPVFHNKQRIFSSTIFTQSFVFSPFFLSYGLILSLKLVNRSIKYLTALSFKKKKKRQGKRSPVRHTWLHCSLSLYFIFHRKMLKSIIFLNVLQAKNEPSRVSIALLVARATKQYSPEYLPV